NAFNLDVADLGEYDELIICLQFTYGSNTSVALLVGDNSQFYSNVYYTEGVSGPGIIASKGNSAGTSSVAQQAHIYSFNKSVPKVVTGLGSYNSIRVSSPLTRIRLNTVASHTAN